MTRAVGRGRLTLVQQNDTPAHIAPHPELRWHNGRTEAWQAGGAAHIRAMVDAIRVEVGGACVHVDSGDAIHGTGPAQWTHGAAIVPVLNAAGEELMTPGNWEFGFGPAVLRERVAALGFPVLACNVQRADTSEPEFAATAVREVGGAAAVAEREYVVTGAGEQSVPPHVPRTPAGTRAIDAMRAFLQQDGPFAFGDDPPSLTAV